MADRIGASKIEPLLQVQASANRDCENEGKIQHPINRTTLQAAKIIQIKM